MVITIVLVFITIGGTLVVTVGEEGLSQWLELGGVGYLYRWTDPTIHVTPRVHGPRRGFRKTRAGGMDLPLAAATLDRGLPNLMGADRARKFGVCWANIGGVRVDVATCKKENKKTRKVGRAN